MRKIAVITDAVSVDFYFPLWYSYYSQLFGAHNLHVAVPEDYDFPVATFPVGGVISFPRFDNEARVNLIGDLVGRLIQECDFVIHADVDEILVANPYKFPSLSHYIEQLGLSHVTARGYNLIEGADDLPLDLRSPILTFQRRYMYPYAALNKTSIVSEPTHWLPGFHFCNHRPQFDDLLLIHLKFADIAMQLRIGSQVADLTPDPRFVSYHRTPEDVLRERMQSIYNYPMHEAISELYRENYTREFCDAIRHVAAFGGIYDGEILPPEPVLLKLGPEFGGLF